MLVEEVQQEGTLDDDESDLIKNAIEFCHFFEIRKKSFVFREPFHALDCIW